MRQVHSVGHQDATAPWTDAGASPRNTTGPVGRLISPDVAAPAAASAAPSPTASASVTTSAASATTVATRSLTSGPMDATSTARAIPTTMLATRAAVAGSNRE